MADGTTLNTGAGGDKIDTEDLGARGKLPRSKLVLGAIDADGGDVAAANPLPVQLTDGTHPAGKTFDLDTSGSTHEWQVGIGLRISASGGSIEAKGQKTMASSIPVALASDQSGVPVTGTFWQATQPVSGTVSIAANSAVNVAQVGGTAADTNSGTKSAGTLRIVIATDQPALSNALKVDGSAVTQPVSGTVTVNAGTGTFTVSVSNATLAVTQSGVWTVATNADTAIGGTAVPSKGLLVIGKTNDGTPQYQPVPEGAGGRSVIVEGYAGGTAVPVSGTVSIAANSAVNLAQVGGSAVATAAGGIAKVGLTDGAGTGVLVGQTTLSASLPVAIASDQSELKVVGDTVSATLSPTITASAYSSGNVVGGALTLTGVLRVINGLVTLQDLVVIDKGNQKAPFTILIFDGSTLGQTYTDKTACPTLGTDSPKIVAQVLVAAADYTTTGGTAIAHEKNLSLVLQGAGGNKNLQAVVVTTGTPTPASTSDLTLKFKFYQD